MDMDCSVVHKPPCTLAKESIHRHFCLTYKPLTSLAILYYQCHTCVLQITLLFFSSLPLKQLDRETAEIVRPCGIHWLIMVVMQKYHDPVYKPPPLVCPIIASRKGGGICGILWYIGCVQEDSTQMVMYKRIPCRCVNEFYVTI